MFKDRQDAGRQLADRLSKYRHSDSVVLALPRGGVVTGNEVAIALGLPLDIVVIRKIGHPYSPEYAIGAVDDKGTTIFNDAAAAAVDKEWLRNETNRQKEEAVRRRDIYRSGDEPIEIAGKTALIVDDGTATGLTMRLAVRAVKARKPARIVVALPVAPAAAIELLLKEADEVVVLEPPDKFLGAVGSHYLSFEQVEDEEVIRLLGGGNVEGN
ncbi:MAG: phosphoribosyltransferase family protein [bacterium]|nr:phosphoribosyltransferase family protein [bacterium]